MFWDWFTTTPESLLQANFIINGPGADHMPELQRQYGSAYGDPYSPISEDRAKRVLPRLNVGDTVSTGANYSYRLVEKEFVPGSPKPLIVYQFAPESFLRRLTWRLWSMWKTVIGTQPLYGDMRFGREGIGRWIGKIVAAFKAH